MQGGGDEGGGGGVPSFSSSLRFESNESTSSMKITAGSLVRAIANKARTNFSPSPTHFEVSDEELIEKKVDLQELAMHFASMVLPVPGGPNSSTPLVGSERPWNRSGRICG